MICLQKAFLNDNVTICNFTSYNYINNTDRASCSTSILIHNKIPQHRIIFDANLQDVAALATLHRTINVCSIYTPPRDQIIDTGLLQQLPRPLILMDVPVV